MAYDTYTKLLDHLDGADGATTHTADTGQTVTFVGTAQLDTAIKVFGTASLLLDGNSDYITVPDSADWDMGSGAWTVDCRVYPTADQRMGVFSQRTDDDNMVYGEIFETNQTVRLALWNSNVVQTVDTSNAVTLNAWNHLAFVCDGSNYYVFVNGVLGAGPTAVSKTWNGFAGTLQIGHETDGTPTERWFSGNIEEVRVSKGIARWTSSFNLPISAYGLGVGSRTIII